MNPAARPVPLQLVTFAILSPLNTPLYIHSYTGKQDEFRYIQIAHSALDIIEEKGEQSLPNREHGLTMPLRRRVSS